MRHPYLSDHFFTRTSPISLPFSSTLGRLTSALSCAVMALQAAVRIGGLDTQTALTHHVMVAALLGELGESDRRISCK